MVTPGLDIIIWMKFINTMAERKFPQVSLCCQLYFIKKKKQENIDVS